jgi:hypothetical protein
MAVVRRSSRARAASCAARADKSSGCERGADVDNTGAPGAPGEESFRPSSGGKVDADAGAGGR